MTIKLRSFPKVDPVLARNLHGDFPAAEATCLWQTHQQIDPNNSSDDSKDPKHPSAQHQLLSKKGSTIAIQVVWVVEWTG